MICFLSTTVGGGVSETLRIKRFGYSEGIRAYSESEGRKISFAEVLITRSYVKKGALAYDQTG